MEGMMLSSAGAGGYCFSNIFKGLQSKRACSRRQAEEFVQGQVSACGVGAEGEAATPQ